MKQSEENFLNMVHTVLETLKKNQHNWSSEAVIVKEVNAIDRDYNQILGNLNVNSRLDSRVQYDNQNNDLNLIIRATIRLCRRMYLYARHHNDEIILKLVEQSESILVTGSENAVIWCCHAILSRAEWMHYYLIPYQVKATHLARINLLVDDYIQQYGSEKRIKIRDMALNPNVAHQILELKERLTVFDELIDGIITNSMFLSAYHKSRMIIDYSQASKAGTESIFR